MHRPRFWWFSQGKIIAHNGSRVQDGAVVFPLTLKIVFFGGTNIQVCHLKCLCAYLSCTFNHTPHSLLAAVYALPVAGLEVRHRPRNAPVRTGGEGGPTHLQERGLHVRHLGEIGDRRAVHRVAERLLYGMVIPVERHAPRGHSSAPDLPDLIIWQKVWDLLFHEKAQKVLHTSRQQLLQSKPVPLVVDLLQGQVTGPTGGFLT